MRHIILYETKSIINDKTKIYVGVHETNNLNNGYLGSGKLIKRAIKCHGKEYFTRTTLEVFQTKKAAYEREAIIVNKDFLARDDVYNICEGGGGFGSSEDASRAAKIKNNLYPIDNTIVRAAYDLKMATDPEFKEKALNHIKNLSKDPEIISKRVATFRKLGHGVGEKNSQYGKRCVYHPIHGCKILDQTELSQHLSEGWIKGRLPKVS
jgi:hypothetical protein